MTPGWGAAGAVGECGLHLLGEQGAQVPSSETPIEPPMVGNRVAAPLVTPTGGVRSSVYKISDY